MFSYYLALWVSERPCSPYYDQIQKAHPPPTRGYRVRAVHDDQILDHEIDQEEFFGDHMK